MMVNPAALTHDSRGLDARGGVDGDPKDGDCALVGGGRGRQHQSDDEGVRQRLGLGG